MNSISRLLFQGPHQRPPTLGRLESDVLRILWSRGESSVRDVLTDLGRPLAYTTIMTTLDRLYKKGLLDRHMADRSFRYIPRVPANQTSLGNTVISPSTQAARDLLVSHLVDTVCEYDESLLDDLERDIANRRLQLSQQSFLRRGDGR
jgi:predicted transcriptional regulator